MFHNLNSCGHSGNPSRNISDNKDTHFGSAGSPLGFPDHLEVARYQPMAVIEVPVIEAGPPWDWQAFQSDVPRALEQLSLQRKQWDAEPARSEFKLLPKWVTFDKLTSLSLGEGTALPPSLQRAHNKTVLNRLLVDIITMCTWRTEHNVLD